MVKVVVAQEQAQDARSSSSTTHTRKHKHKTDAQATRSTHTRKQRSEARTSLVQPPLKLFDVSHAVTVHINLLQSLLELDNLVSLLLLHLEQAAHWPEIP
mmetsp:Transcript_27709/g.67543  ORF Transcript_27709/g.67543 Transcript_27709/m.67543 type:complete len:100 (-) Transcript_27709:1852-2151(-)